MAGTATRTRANDELVMRAVGAVAGLMSVAALLAWVAGLGAFKAWFLLTGVPAIATLIGLGVITSRRPEQWPTVRRALVAGSVGGLAGTIGYDLFRIPFIVGGLRLFAPIDSYGVLLADAATSSPFTGFVGWTYHLANGVGFGIAYAMVMLGRRPIYAVAWGLILETATIVTPFADAYGLRGKWDLIAIAYAAHLAYGIPLGMIVERGAHWPLRRPLLVPASALLVLAVAGIAVWTQPWKAATSPPTIADGRFDPEWSRIAPGECAVYDDQRFCPTGKGAHRIKLTDEPYSGGFVLVDPES